MPSAQLTKSWQRADPAVRARARWQLLTEHRPEQRTPPGDWTVWLFMAGRGAGKTRAAAEDMAYYGLTHPRTRLAIVAPTYSDARDTCVEGESGLLACLPRSAVKLWNRSLGELVLANGTRFKLFSSDEPDRLRGPQHHRAWCDELAMFRSAETWHMLQMGLRLGQRPQCVATTTPKPVGVLRELLGRGDVKVTRGTTWDNAANLAPAALESLRRRYEGTRRGRQELLGEYLEDVEGALWQRSWIVHVADAPYGGWQKGPIVGLDPADGTEDGAEHGIAAVALGMDHDLYVIASEGLRGETPAAAARRAVGLTAELGGRLVIEKNFGGRWLETVIEQAVRETGLRVPYSLVNAADGKRTRAEPCAALYEQGHVKHLGEFAELEDQMCVWTGSPGEVSPDRLDALVWAMAEFTGQTFGPAPEPKVHEYTDGAVAGVHRWS